MRFAVLLHGLGRSAFSMRPVERRLAAHGYEVLNVGYPSTTAAIPVLAADVAAGSRPGTLTNRSISSRTRSAESFFATPFPLANFHDLAFVAS